MTVFVSHAAADREAAEALENFLERRGQFVELDDGETALRPVQASDVVVALISKDFVFSPWRLRMEQRALDAWADGRLILVKLDHAFAPVGMRDLPFVDASFAAQREFTWGEVAKQVMEKVRPRPPAASDRAASAPPPPARKRAPGGGGRDEGAENLRERRDQEIRARRRFWWVTPLIALPGLFALTATIAIWLANRIGPTPGTTADLVAGIDAFGARAGLPAGVTPILFAAAIFVTVAAILRASVAGMVRARLWKKLREDHPELSEDYEAAPMPSAPQAPAGEEAVFISYARANAPIVTPMCDEIKKSGRKLWIDQDGIGAGDGWAGEIVRAIRGAQGVLVMCSNAAFESDHVKREVYLADRYKKKLLPIFIEDAQPPEDFEYFFAGVQFLKLHETPEGERPAAVLRILGSV